MRTPPARPQPNAGHAPGRNPEIGRQEGLSSEQFALVLEYQQMWRCLALRLLNSNTIPPPFTVGVTSAIPGEGKTAASIGLAVALAQEGTQQVGLIDANFHSPALARDFNVRNEPGLIDYLHGRASLWDAARATGIEQLTLFVAGSPARPPTRPAPGGLNGRTRPQFREVLCQLEQQFPWMVLDLPPILGNVDTEEILRSGPGVILIARSGVTPLDKLRQAAQRLEKGKLLGVVHLARRQGLPRWAARLISE